MRREVESFYVLYVEKGLFQEVRSMSIPRDIFREESPVLTVPNLWLIKRTLQSFEDLSQVPPVAAGSSPNRGAGQASQV